MKQAQTWLWIFLLSLARSRYFGVLVTTGILAAATADAVAVRSMLTASLACSSAVLFSSAWVCVWMLYAQVGTCVRALVAAYMRELVRYVSKCVCEFDANDRCALVFLL